MGIKDIAQGVFLQSALTDVLARELQLREIMTLEILRDEFNFTQDQLNAFADFKIKKMEETRRSQLNIP